MEPECKTSITEADTRANGNLFWNVCWHFLKLHAKKTHSVPPLLVQMKPCACSVTLKQNEQA